MLLNVKENLSKPPLSHSVPRQFSQRIRVGLSGTASCSIPAGPIQHSTKRRRTVTAESDEARLSRRFSDELPQAYRNTRGEVSIISAHFHRVPWTPHVLILCQHNSDLCAIADRFYSLILQLRDLK